MKLFLSLAIALSMILFVKQVYAIEGNLLYEACQSRENSWDNGFCVGFVSAVYQALVEFEGEQCHMFSDGSVRTTQLKDIAINFFKNHPEKRHFDAFGTLFMEFGKVSGCIKENKK